MERVADRQLSHPSAHPTTDWTQGAGYTGIMALAGISGDPKYRDAMQTMGETNHWQLGPKPYHADDHIVGQTYADLYLLRRDPAMIAPMRESFDFVFNYPSPASSLDFKSPHALDLWSWCDALYMAPPAWIALYQATGDTRYKDYAITNWWRTYDYLYDKEEHLFFRDSSYFDKKEANGKKVFWGRGNGWVMGALVHMLQRLPAGTPEYDATRARFQKLYLEMAPKILSCQQPDGLWRASLLDPASYSLKETSGSAFYTYALAWGVNQGLLDRATYEPAIRKAWTALVDCVDPDGKLTHVQPIGADPKNFASDATEIYGVGAFLLAGSELYRMALLEATHPMVVKVSNPSSLWRESQTVSLDLAGEHVVMEGNSSRILDSQSYNSEMVPEPGSPKFLFQTDLAPGEKRSFMIFDKKDLPTTPQPIIKTSARFVPERLDDFAWESDRIAHRIYGQALMTSKEGTVSSGVDVWIKKPRQLTIDILYKSGHYHEDNGLYLDDYRVGKSRGCGGLGIWDGKQLLVSKNYRNWKLITTGPIRSEFEVTYDPWDAGNGRMVSETKRLSIDAGSWFTEATSTFSSTNDSPLMIGVGLAERTCGPNGTQLIGTNKKEGWMTYWQPEDKPKGATGAAILLPKGRVSEFTVDQKEMPEAKLHEVTQFPVQEGTPALRSLLAITQVEVGKPFTYLLGACWDRSGDFTNNLQWDAYTAHVAQLRDHPIKISIEKPAATKNP
jgi:rhamnogalacturonyl hydrolase YesR